MTYKFYGQNEDKELEIIPDPINSKILISMTGMGFPEFTTTLDKEDIFQLIRALNTIHNELD